MDLIISERNRVNQRIKELEGHIRLNNNAEKRLRKSTCNVDFNRNRIVKMKLENEAFEKQIVDLNERLKDLQSGKLTAELHSRRKRDTAIAREKTIQKRQKKMEGLEEKQEQSKVSKQFYSKNRKSDRVLKYESKNCARQYSYMLRVCSTLPTYIKNNLENMPNNKGYIWRGIHFFGKKEKESDTIVLFETKRGGALLIHKWEDNFLKYTLISKSDKRSTGKIEFVEEYKKCEFSKKRVLLNRRKPFPHEIKRGGHGHQSAPRNARKTHTRNRGRYPARGSTRNNGCRAQEKNKKSKKLTPAEARKRSRGKINKIFQERKRAPRNRKRAGRGASASRGRGRGRGRPTLDGKK
jgi:hypothetical protein